VRARRPNRQTANPLTPGTHRYGLPEDVWFHVDSLSSAHVYLRQKKGEKIADIPEFMLEAMCQLVKANSIEGCKLHQVYVIHTRWRNLHKTSSMEVGQIGMHDRSKVKRMLVEKDKEVVKLISKTKKTEFPDLEALQQERAARFQAAKKAEKREDFLNEKAAKNERREQAELRSYA
jgi:hypothetical protein